jgi:hypothetical protein
MQDNQDKEQVRMKDTQITGENKKSRRGYGCLCSMLSVNKKAKCRTITTQNQVRVKYKQSTRENNKNLDGNMVVCVVLTSRCLCDGPIPRTEESLPTVVCDCVLSRNLKNEAALARVGLLRQKKGGGENILLLRLCALGHLHFGYVSKNIFTHAINKRRHQQDKHNNTECISKLDILWHAKLS